MFLRASARSANEPNGRANSLCWGQGHTGVPIEKLYPDLVQRDESRKIPRAIKRVTDVLGSAMALILLAYRVRVRTRASRTSRRPCT